MSQPSKTDELPSPPRLAGTTGDGYLDVLARGLDEEE